ncbi:MAG: bifunctional methylenetetrahydrofolate dehydrogenase/methenyltetrahydrofolate cyclohydrolase FolD [Bacteroidales bacterium]|jgi:methylenetetrahydrofolate dehydrogenase (NADP+)/methenyltetrahydrofolate cyclohydrolase|nr:bifunctional methylenetetrahydrofolate dehydrogenase/methenyltetrahydrofolate cyclohydrolase FolD [Bacteroidales bacterium]
MKLIDGKKIAEGIREEIKAEVAKMIDDEDKAPHLAAVIVGEDPASQTYVAGKEKACKSVGFMSSVYRLPEATTEKELLELIDFLNNDPEIDGFIVQLPLPGHISEEKVIQRIDPKKDVDGFHPVNLGRMVSGLPAYLSATPYGILQLLERSNIETEGKHCVVLGRSNIVGTPVSILLSRKASPGNCTVTICHSKTKNIKEIAASADILIAAIGQQEFVTADMVKTGAVVIDVGMHRMPSEKTKSGYKLKGDVAFEEVARKCSYITPVPGGVGPMTITGLLQNTLKAHKKEIYE